MKEWKSEFAYNYDTYSYAYACYAQKEAEDTLNEIYEQGYLPYSGSPDVHDVFYLARSARLYIPSFEMNSECRRVARLFDGEKFKRIVTPKRNFNVTPKFTSFVTTYFDTVLSPGIMPKSRLEHILQSQTLTHIVSYLKDNSPIAYTLRVEDEKMVHPWFPTYHPTYAKKSFGIWLMIDSIRIAQKEGQDYFYFGTAYGQKAKYKMNFGPIEYWAGSEWKSDPKNKTLKEFVNSEMHSDHTDAWNESLRHF